MTQTDCGGTTPLRLQRAWRVWLVAGLAFSSLSGFVDAQAPALPQIQAEPSHLGFSRPAPTPAGQVSANTIVGVRLLGASEEVTNDLAESLRTRVGQTPSRQRLADDVEALLASDRFTAVRPSWKQVRTGWILTYELLPKSTAPRVPVIRGQSDEIGSPETEPANSGTGSSGNSDSEIGGYADFAPRTTQAPSMPSAPEDQEFQKASVHAQAGVALDEPLANVRVEGNVTIPVSEIQRHIKVRPERTVTQTMIKEDVDAMIRTRWFVSVEPVISRTEEGLVLTYRVLERPIVRNVEYRGINKMKLEKLEALTNLKVGSPFDVSANKECARRIEEMYHEKGFAFATVELEKGGNRNDREVVFLIEEGPKVQVTGVRYEGNQFFSKALLDMKLQTKKRILWSFGGKYDPATIPNDKASITRYYRGLGFFDMAIDHDLQFNADRSHVTIVYKIDEGLRYRIRNVAIRGNDVIPTDVLASDHSIKSGEFFTDRKLSSDVDKMREKYGTLGRLFARVDAVPRFTEEPGVVDIEYQIDEDKVYRVREFNVHIAGDHPHTRTNLPRNISLIQPGDLADPKKIQATKVRMAGSGYFEAGGELAPRLEISRVDDPGWIRVPESELARAQNDQKPLPPRQQTPAPLNTASGRTAPLSTAKPPLAPASSSGLSPLLRSPVPPSPPVRSDATRPGVSRLMDSPDSVFEGGPSQESRDQAIIQRANAVIRGQNDMMMAQSRGPLEEPQNYLWDNNPQGDPLNNAIRDVGPDMWERLPPPEFIDIDAYLAEARTGRLMFGVGVNSDAGVIGNIVLSENNFDIMRPPTSWEDVWNGTAWRGAGQKFRIEALPGSEVSRYLVDWQDPYFMDTDVNLGVSGFYYTRFFRFWDEERLGGRLRLGKQFTQTWSGSVALRMENVDISGAYVPTPPDLAEAVGSNFLSTVRLALAHDTRDAAFLPTTGHFVEFSVEQAFAEYSYNRLEVDGRQYFTTYQRPDGGGKHVINLHGNFGWTSSDTPIFERFYAGGFQSFRGFAFRGVSPQENGVEVGGEFLMLGSVEYQLPVTANEMLKVVAFSDFGTVDTDVTFDNFRVTAGAGLRIQVPGMGPVPIALDWAVPIKKTDFDRTQLFSFYIGINR